MQLVDVLSAMRIPQAAELFRPCWDESMAALPESTPEFLTEARLRQSFALSGLSPEALELLLLAAERIRADAHALPLAWHCVRLAWDEADYPREQIDQWPELDDALGDDAGLFYLLVLLDAIPRVQALHGSLGVPREVTEADLLFVGYLARHYPELHPGRFGVLPRLVGWGRFHTQGMIFTLGRFEYMVRPFRGKLVAFRDRQGAVVALAGQGLVCGADGMCVAEPDGGPPSGGWTCELEMDADGATGYPVSPLGRVLPEKRRLSARRWQPVLREGDPVLETHIPPGGRMSPEAVRDSYERALAFFPRYFPDRPFRAIACTSWILNPELETILWTDNNCARWQRESYLFPVVSGFRSGLFHVFSRENVDPASAPRKTRLHRAVAEHLEAGGRFIVGGMFFLPEDLADFGSQPYRRRFPF